MSNNNNSTLPARDRSTNTDPVLARYHNRLLDLRDRLSGVMAQQAANSATVQGSMGPPPLPTQAMRAAVHGPPNYHSHTMPGTSQTPSNGPSSAQTGTSTAPAQSSRRLPPRFPQHLPSGWLLDTCMTTLNQNPSQIWNAVYRPGIKGQYCQHTIHSTWDGTRHLLIPNEPVVRSRIQPGLLQSAVCWLTMFPKDVCWLTMFPKDENAYVNPTTFSQTDYTIFQEMPSFAEAEQRVRDFGTTASLYLDKAKTCEMPGTCRYEHTDEEPSRLNQEELFTWATIADSRETIYMCRSCMETRTGLNTAGVFAKYGA